MFRSASRSVLRGPSATQQLRFAQSRRFISSPSTPPAQRSRGWRSTVVRWGLAIGAVYYYNTSPVFAEEPLTVHTGKGQEDSSSSLPTLESVAAAKSRKPSPPSPTPQPQQQQSEQSTPSDSSLGAAADAEVSPSDAQALELSPEELENEAGQEGAFNPETGEINWDCPCLGGMAHGPCGEEFRDAFSCFVYSEEEPKGMDCIDKFKGMQDCFRLHPEIYGGEIDEDDVDEQLEEHIEGEKATLDSDEGAREKTLREVNQGLDPSVGDIQAPEKWHDASSKNGEVEKK